VEVSTDAELARDTWLVVPLYNEATVIQDVVRQARETFPNVVCVDDGSADDSAAEAERGGARVVRHPINLGQGAALQTGLRFAVEQPGTRFVVTFDADGQHRTEDALAMVRRLDRERLDVVIGSRFLDGRTRPGLLKRIVLKGAVVLQRMTSGLRLTDAHNGLRAMTRDTAARLRITQNRMAHASEIIDQIGSLELRYAEEPVHVIYTDYSRSKGQSLWNSVNILSELIFK